MVSRLIFTCTKAHITQWNANQKRMEGEKSEQEEEENEKEEEEGVEE